MKDLDALTLEPPLKLVGLYQDPTTRDWADQLTELARTQGGESGVKSAYWRLDLMSDPELFAQAVAAAADANLLILAAYAHTELPREVKRWVAACVASTRSGPRALVALLGKRAFDEEPFPTAEYLAAVAETSGLDYFVREYSLHSEPIGLTLESASVRAHAKTALLSDILRRTDEDRLWIQPDLIW